jgi:MFS family permease
MNKTFYGWWITAAAFCTFGIAVGIPYYGMPFFYDYYKNAYGWTTAATTLGFPIGALLTLWVGPVIIPRFSQRKLIMGGTLLTFLAFIGWSQMGGNLIWYYFLWFIYTMGYMLSGPIPHQVIISHWFKKNRGMAMGICYVGVGVFAAFSSKLVKWVTEGYNFHIALITVGCIMFLAWPLAIFVLRDRPSEKGLYADGAPTPPAHANVATMTLSGLLGQWNFWLLLIGSICSIGAIGSVNFHMKLAFREQGFTDQNQLNALWSNAQFWISITSIAGRLLIGRFSDIFPMKYVMTVTYFIVAGAIPMLLMVTPGSNPYAFAVIFGFAMGADYMLIPLMAAKQFGVNSLATAMAIILPVNTIGQTWVPQLVSVLHDHYHSYEIAMNYVLGLAMIGAVAIALLPKSGIEDKAEQKAAPAASPAVS